MDDTRLEDLADALVSEARRRFPDATESKHKALRQFIDNGTFTRMSLRQKLDALYDNLNGSSLIWVLEEFPEFDR